MIRELPFRNKPLIMGILNVTPDSFYDGGKHDTLDSALAHAVQMIEDGADIIDVGGESTRPFADEVGVEEELERVLPVVKMIRSRYEIPISIDTYKADVAREACQAGADIINDISGLTFDPGMAACAAKYGVYVVIMHTKGTPREMQKDPYYDDVIEEICQYLERQTEVARRAGVSEDRIILDPGIGFGKRVEDNLKILKKMSDFKKLGKPVLIGPSMKSFIGKVLNDPLEERLVGTLASVAVSVMNGADIVRVHDVAKTRKVVGLVDAVMKS